MHPSRHLVPLCATLAVAALPWLGRDATAQQRDVVSSQIEVSNSEASLRIEFFDGGGLTLDFADGTATLDGEILGRYEPGGAADRAWRGLLASVLSLSDGPLARELERWRPGAELDGDDLDLLQRVDAALASALVDRAPPPPPEPEVRAPESPEPPSTATLARIREEIRRELEAEMSTRHVSGPRGASRALRAAGDVLGTLFTFLVTGGLALLLMRFAGMRLESVTREIRYHPGRAAAVGFAGGVLLLPVFAVGVVALAVSLIGIPLLLVWIPLFPLAVALAGFMGYVGASHHVGRWVLDQDHAWLDRVDRNRDTHVRLTGLAALLLPFAAGGALGALPLIGWFGGLLQALGTLAGVAALTIGFGAVIITRGGRYATGWPGSLDDEMETAAEWSAAEEVDEESEEEEK